MNSLANVYIKNRSICNGLNIGLNIVKLEACKMVNAL